ncbi:MAG: hypothetical protein IH848_06300 [Acidobacteria bacterium]|nr:hypothetical protein [Acidobacteriota bacterium]
MRKSFYAIIIVIVAMVAPAILAGASQDVRVLKEKDSKGNVVYKLTNAGDRNVRVTLQHKKSCASTTTNQDPTEREYWLMSQRSTHLRKVVANSDCRHTFRIVAAEYY